MPVQSVYPQLEALLPLVRKPVQYVGGELNSVTKDWDAAEVRWALMYPDAYEVGVPNQGVQILYEVLNGCDGVLAERTYSVWPDLEELMRAHQVPQFTVDAHRPVRAFDVLGVSFATELGYTNLRTALDLAGIPLAAAARGGDGMLLSLATAGGVYVPRFYDVDYRPDATIGRVVPNRPGVPRAVAKHTVMDLDSWPYPSKPLVPVHESVHERFSVEIFRGCTRGCRFCQAGMITRPVRERSITTIGEMVSKGLAESGFQEVGLLSLSSADHSEINELATGLADQYAGTNTGLSLPSTRVDAFNVTLANELSRNGRRSGLTFAPEGGTDRIRRVINKMVTEEDLIQTVTTAYANGWRQVKLYFMCGLPTETDEDVLAIARVAHRVIETGRAASGRRDIRCTGSIGGVVAQPHTPFQWAAQCDHETVDARLKALGAAMRADRGYGSSIGFRYHDGRPSVVEGLLSRGDRRVAKVIRAAWADGGRFDGWSEHFSYERWAACAAAELAADGIDLDWYTTRERSYAEILPWDHLDAGLDRDWLWQDWLAAIDPAGPAEVDDCRWTPCFECGVCPAMGTEIETGPTGARLLPLTVAAGRAMARPGETPAALPAAAPVAVGGSSGSLPAGPVLHAGAVLPAGTGRGA